MNELSRELEKKTGCSVDVEVDGGINDQTAVACGAAGVNVFVAGSYVFGSPDYKERIEAVRTAAQGT